MKTIGTKAWRINADSFKSLRIYPANPDWPSRIIVNDSYHCTDYEEGVDLLKAMAKHGIIPEEEDALNTHLEEWDRVVQEQPED